ncbi:MAG: phosphopantetheine-binding protein [Hydrogenophaga sp.]|jgi:serine acetyltransferase/acyl carrier protein|nr:phosphopantetheine-binding protein [Hydrogenophaga sp.]
MKSALYLCGVGNGEGIRLAMTINRLRPRWHRIVLLDDDPAKHGTTRLGLEVAGPISHLSGVDAACSEVANLVTRTTEGRARAREKIGQYGVPFTSLIHPGVDLFGAEVAPDVTIYQNVSVGAEACIGLASVLLIGAVVGHGSRIGQGCVIAPNAVINARVTVDDRAYVGSNASILPDLRIGADATIGANCMVYADIPEGATAMGVPAQILDAAPRHGPSGPQGTQDTPPALASDRIPNSADASSEQAEAIIMQALLQVLGVESVSRNGNFFELGCSSLKALELAQRLRSQLGRELQVVDIYRCPTPSSLARFLSGSGPGTSGMRQAQQRADMRRQLRLRQ